MGDSERQLAEKIRDGDESAFEELFFAYFYDLSAFAFQMIHSNEQAEDIVQEVFYRLWKNRREWSVSTSVKSYLFKSVRNETLNQIEKKQNRINKAEEYKEELTYFQGPTEERISRSEQRLIGRIWDIVGGMPERRKTVFILHRKHGFSYREISAIMDISRKTVENHMGIALNEIREKLNIKQF